MKKIAALFFFFLLYLFWNSNDKVEMVSSETTYLSFPSYCSILFYNKDVSTKNFEKYFSKETVISIQPFIKEIYKSKMQNVENYTFTSDNHINNLILLEDLYIKKLKDNGIVNDAAKIPIYSVPIHKVKLLCNDTNFPLLKGLSYEIKVENR